jgi:hypothetical protein
VSISVHFNDSAVPALLASSNLSIPRMDVVFFPLTFCNPRLSLKSLNFNALSIRDVFNNFSINFSLTSHLLPNLVDGVVRYSLI